MRRIILAALLALAAAVASGAVSPVFAQEGKQTCRMEKQCRWENFKKICVYVKVCR